MVRRSLRLSKIVMSGVVVLLGVATTPVFASARVGGPAQPTIESTDFPEWTAVRSTGERGTVTFRHAAVDDDVAGFAYGFSADALTGWVPADANGDATLPVTLWPNPETGAAEAFLYVQAEDASGNRSEAVGPYVMFANDNGAVPPGRPGDVNGDGLGDMSVLAPSGPDRLRIWTVTSAGTAFHTPYVGWDTGHDGSSSTTTRAVPGDFTGDGLSDHAVFRRDPDGRTRLFIVRSGGHRFDAVGDAVWVSPADPRWDAAVLRVTSGDVDGDGVDDLVAIVDDGPSGWTAQVWTAADGHASITAWSTRPASATDLTALVGDYDGDGDGDLATVTGTPTGRTVVEVHTSTGSSFGAPATWIDAAGLGYGSATFTVGNFDGDSGGRDELAALNDVGSGQARVVVFPSTGTAFATAEQWWPAVGTSAAFDASDPLPVAADFDGDGATDLGVVNDGATVDTKGLWAFASTGAGFAEPQHIVELGP